LDQIKYKRTACQKRNDSNKESILELDIKVRTANEWSRRRQATCPHKSNL